MRITITKPDGDLKREIWDFDFEVSHQMILYFDAFFFQTKESRRHHKWQTQSHWDRLYRRSNTIECPTPPQEIIGQVKQELTNMLVGMNYTA